MRHGSAILLGLLLSAPAAGGATKGIVVDQMAKGLPGERRRDIRQRISIRPDRLRLEDLKSGGTYILRLDRDGQGVLWEIRPGGKEYLETKDLSQIQSERKLREAETIRFIKEKFPDRWKEELENEHLKADGTRDVRIEEPPGEREIEVGGRRWRARRLVAYENDDKVLDVWYTPEELAGGSRSYYHFYERLGAFSPEVLRKLSGRPGFPLEATFKVITGTVDYEITAKVEGIEEAADLPDSLFERPEGCELVEEKATAECVVCGKELEIPAVPELFVIGGKQYYFCSKAHKDEWRRQFLYGPPAPPPPKPPSAKGVVPGTGGSETTAPGGSGEAPVKEEGPPGPGGQGEPGE